MKITVLYTAKTEMEHADMSLHLSKLEDPALDRVLEVYQDKGFYWDNSCVAVAMKFETSPGKHFYAIGFNVDGLEYLVHDRKLPGNKKATTDSLIQSMTSQPWKPNK